jgi:hypothetical protein
MIEAQTLSDQERLVPLAADFLGATGTASADPAEDAKELWELEAGGYCFEAARTGGEVLQRVREVSNPGERHAAAEVLGLVAWYAQHERSTVGQEAAAVDEALTRTDLPGRLAYGVVRLTTACEAYKDGKFRATYGTVIEPGSALRMARQALTPAKS